MGDVGHGLGCTGEPGWALRHGFDPLGRTL